MGPWDLYACHGTMGPVDHWMTGPTGPTGPGIVVLDYPPTLSEGPADMGYGQLLKKTALVSVRPTLQSQMLPAVICAMDSLDLP